MAKNQTFKNYSGDYFIGLDIGTNSVGWAVVDDRMNLLKYNGRNAWGSRLFDEANTAQERRVQRGLRRRYVRRKVRLNTLRELMAPMVNDDAFFQRLDESFYNIDDRTQKNRFNIFNDSNFTDQDYNLQYPTIYHLRNKLIKEDRMFDARLVYLAIHHILKYRGNFLFPELNANQNESNIEDMFSNILDWFEENGYVDIKPDCEQTEIIQILLSKDINNSEKIKEVSNKYNKEFFKLILGQKANLDKIFDGNEFGEQSSLSFKDEDIDSKIANLDSFVEILNQCYEFYNLIQYQSIMAGSNYISEIMISRYEKYGKDLRLLRDVLRNSLPKKEHHSYFRDLQGKGNEHNYAHYTERGGECSYDDFKASLKKLLDRIESSCENEEILNKISSIKKSMEEDNFLRKLKTRDNTAFPMQVNKIELEAIIDNQAKYYPYLAEIKSKILVLFEFRIDYFVGPLAKRNPNDFGWVKKKIGYENKTITAFNYKEAIDFEASQEEFITRMTRDCTYILGEKALPKNSIYYAVFNVLNEINNIKYITDNGEYPLPDSVREQIFEELKKKNIVKKKEIEHMLQSVTSETNIQVRLSGVDKLNNNLKPYKDFLNLFGYVDGRNIDMIENLIKWITIFGESKSTLKQKITKVYGNVLSKAEIDAISRFNYTGWGRLSKKLIYGLTYKKGEEYKTILDLMQEKHSNNYYWNFNAVYSKYRFKEQVEDLNSAVTKPSFKENVENLAGSPAIKRGINQAYKIVKEIIKLFKRPPAKIYIEFARNEDEKVRKVNRKKQIEEKYKAIMKNREDLLAHMRYMDCKPLDVFKVEENDKKFDSEKFFLYFLQAGKCAYTGRELDLNKLEQYHVDHIVPRSIIKDDSLDNKVLVTAEANEKKGDNETVPVEFQDKMREIWKLWRDVGKDEHLNLMTNEKYLRLTRTTLTEEDRKHFINRQIVETRQIIINTCELLQNFFLTKGYDVEIKPVRAGLNSDFRNMFKYYKGLGGRAINDFHHAKDAYISVFMGRYLDCNFEKYSTNFATFNTQAYSKNQPQKYGYVLNTLYNKNKFWGESDLTNEEALANFDRNYYYSDILYTRMTTMDLDGEFYDQTRYKNKKNAEKFGSATKNKLVSLKINKDKTGYLSTDYYGGYTSLKPACFAVILDKSKKKSKLSFIGVPILYLVKKNKAELNKYIKVDLGITDYKLIRFISMQQLFKTDGILFRVTGILDRNTASQLVFGRKNKQLYEFIYHIYNDLKSLKIENEQEKIQYFEENYNLFKKVYLNHIDNNFPDFNKSIKNKVEKVFEKYDILDINERIKAIKEILKITQCNSNRSSISEFEVRPKFSIDFLNSYLIYQSVTGLCQKTVKITDLV